VQEKHLPNGKSKLACRRVPLSRVVPSTFHLKFYYEVEWPPWRFVKLNFDGSRIHNSTVSRFIIRYWVGNLHKASAAPYEDSSILVAKA